MDRVDPSITAIACYMAIQAPTEKKSHGAAVRSWRTALASAKAQEVVPSMKALVERMLPDDAYAAELVDTLTR